MSSVSFRVNDTGVASFIDKLKQKSSELTSEMIRDAQRQTNVAKEQISLVEEKIKALEEKNVLKSIKTYAGTSIGGQTCALLNIGYNADEMFRFIELFDFSKLRKE